AAAVILVGLVKRVTKSLDTLGFRPCHITAIINVDRFVDDLRGIGLRVRLGGGRRGGRTGRRGLSRRRTFLCHGRSVRADSAASEQEHGGGECDGLGCVG